MLFLRRSLTGLFLLSLTLGLLAYAGGVFFDALEERANRESRQRPARERIISVNSVEAQPGSVIPVISTFGEIQSRRSLEIRAGTGGRIVQLSENFESGAQVEAGALLALVDPKDAESAVEVARTDLEEAETELADAERNLALVRDELAATQAQADLRTQALQRQRDLAARGVGTEAAVETAALAEASAKQAVVGRRMSEAAAETRVGQAKSRLNREKLALAVALRDLEDHEVRATFNGTLSDVTVVEGGLVSQNERLGALIDPTALEVAFRLSTTQYARLLDDAGDLIGAPVRVTLDVLELDLEATGRITRVNALVGEGQTGRQLFARLDQFAGFRPGDFVSVSIEEPELRGVVRLPATALDAANTVLVIGEDSRLEVAEVSLLRRQGDDVIVRADDIAGARIVAERTPLIGPGIRVKDLSADRAPEMAGTDATTPQPMGEDETVELTDERRAALIAAVEGNTRMPADAKERILSRLRQDRVPASMVERIESRMGG
ncbi:multidrug resistance efflux pump [Aliiruegeria haliotis]|uniref:Multidrug resistance efflux pump n=1 Tax=Aliiruegeria haliotis TaxID=1280846 RepID=A0A2T0RT19_9RHOB|nr:HlyD family efflux transporter periplasmic adaptor subunit [Aliiruegeria haliotis]PRY24336.1 multidrug resistance efflux pump [Aliiruegeria haliotis]